MDDPNEPAWRLTLAPTVAPLADDPRIAFDRLSTAGFTAVQLDAGRPPLRPRDLDGSARRDLRAVLRRRELMVAGLDAWVPPAHFDDPGLVDRAVTALVETVTLAADLGRVTVSTLLPAGDGPVGAAIDTVAEAAERHGVRLADFARPPRSAAAIGRGLDAAAELAAGDDPVGVAVTGGAGLASVRLVDLLQSGLRGPVGDRRLGRLDVVAFRAGLDVGGWAGAVVVDARGWPDPWAGLEATRAAWQAAAP